MNEMLHLQETMHCKHCARIHCNTCTCDTDPRIRPRAAESPTMGPARLPHRPSLPPPSARRLATERPPTRRAAASARRPHASARLSPHAFTRCDARTLAHQRAPAREQRPDVASCCMGRRGAAAAASGGLGAAAEAEEEVDLVL